MQPTTPIGSRTTVEEPTWREYSNDSATAAAVLNELRGRPTWMMLDSGLAMPVSREIALAISSMRPPRASPMRLMYFARSAAGRALQPSNAALAAAAAFATSPAVPSGTVAMTSSVRESCTAMVPLPSLSTQRPFT